MDFTCFFAVRFLGQCLGTLLKITVPLSQPFTGYFIPLNDKK